MQPNRYFRGADPVKEKKASRRRKKMAFATGGGGGMEAFKK